jgi:hypothetical protein
MHVPDAAHAEGEQRFELDAIHRPVVMSDLDRRGLHLTRVLQGVEGTLQSREVSEARREEEARLRTPRALYGPHALQRPYSEADARWAGRLRTFHGGAFLGRRLLLVAEGLREAALTLVLTTGAGAATVNFSSGYLSAAQVSATLTAAVKGLVVVSSPNGYITLTDTATPGPTSRIQLTGSALEPLGFDQQSGDRGKTVIPPWRLYSRTAVNPEDAVDSLGYYIGFDSVVKQEAFFTVTYPVAPYLCLRCRATEVENDYRFDPQG